MHRPSSKRLNESEVKKLLSEDSLMIPSGADTSSMTGSNKMDPDKELMEDCELLPRPNIDDVSRGESSQPPARWEREYYFPASAYNTTTSVYEGGRDENQRCHSFFAPSAGLHYSYVVMIALFLSTIVQLSRGGLLAYEQKQVWSEEAKIHPNYSHAFSNVHIPNSMASLDEMVDGSNMVNDSINGNNVINNKVPPDNYNNAVQNNNMRGTGNNMISPQQQKQPQQQQNGNQMLADNGIAGQHMQQHLQNNNLHTKSMSNNNVRQGNQANYQFQAQQQGQQQEHNYQLPSANTNMVVNDGMMFNNTVDSSATYVDFVTNKTN